MAEWVGLHNLDYKTEMEGMEEVLNGWTLSYEELSNNVYKVRLKADYGSVVEMTGDSDFESIVARCIESAKEIDKQIRLT